jgi:glycosyltransferase involved in cell wall biosynthesis
MKIGYLMQAGVPDVRGSAGSGPANHVRHVFTELRGLGHEVRLIAQLDRAIWESDDLSEYRRVEVPMDRGIRRLGERVVRRVQYQFRLPYAALFESLRFAAACTLRLQGFDLLYERLGWVGYGGGMAASRLGVPLILEINGDHLPEFEMLGVAPRGFQRKLSVSMMRRCAQRASHAVATGEGWRRAYISNWQIEPDRVSVIENGTDLVKRLAREQLSAFGPADQRPVTLVYVGGFEPWHGLSILLEAARTAFRQGARFRLILAGKGSQESRLRAEAADLGIADRVEFTGYLSPEDLAFALAAAEIGVSPYFGRTEYSGLKLLDYKAAGLAVVASGRDGEPATIEHERTGLIVPPGDPCALAAAIVRLVNDTESRKTMGRRSRLEAESRHGWHHTAQELSALFERFLPGRHAVGSKLADPISERASHA